MASSSGATEIKRGEVSPAARDVAHAPVIYFEAAPAYGFLPGVISVTLTTGTIIPTNDGGTITDHIVVGHLRCNIAAALDLRMVIDKAITMATQPPSPDGKTN